MWLPATKVWDAGVGRTSPLTTTTGAQRPRESTAMRALRQSLGLRGGERDYSPSQPHRSSGADTVETTRFRKGEVR